MRRGWPGGPYGRLTGEVVGRVAVGLGPVGGGHHDVAVLHAGVELDAIAAQMLLQLSDDCGGLIGGGMTAGEVDHGAVGADGGEVAAVGDLVGAELETQRSCLDGGTTGVVPGRVVAEDRHVADIGTRRHAGWNDRRSAERAASGERVDDRGVGGLERRAPAEVGERLVGTAIGDADDVLHRTSVPHVAADMVSGARRAWLR